MNPRRLAYSAATRNWTRIASVLQRYVFALLAAAAFCPAQAATAADDAKIDFAHKVVPILKKHCVACHGGEESEGGFSLNTRALILDAEAAVPRNSAASRMVELILSPDPKEQMPPKDKPRLSQSEVATLRTWIDEGLTWETGFTFAANRYQPPLKPRRTKLPPTRNGREHPIDRILDHYLAAREITPPKPLEDAAFLRRVNFDLVGLPPTVDELVAFLDDTDPQKRSRWIDRILARNQAYAEHWMTFWNDHLRNAYSGTGFIDGGRKQITGWLYRSLEENKPYDQFARELLAPTADSEGFIRGVKWRGNVNASQMREIQFAQTTSQVFLGINMKCASCHDSFIDRWTLEESYNLAAVYSNRPLEIHRCDKPTGRMAQASWIFPELGEIDAEAPQPQRLKQLAGLMTHPQNGRFTRTIVNRLWARLMGRGIVEPPDAMHTEPWNADLLDFLAVHLVDSKYDLKATLRLIATSQAYQSQSVALDSESAVSPTGYVHRGPLGKRLTAEQFLDAVGSMTDTWPQPDGRAFKRDGRGQGGQLAEILGGGADTAAKWGDRPLRAVFTPLTPLQASLGRPIREQVVTSRPSQFTTLEAIELSNGDAMANLVRRAAERLRVLHQDDNQALLDQLFLKSLSRAPSDVERATCQKILSNSLTPEGVEDLLWSVLLLPEFQLIR